VNTVGDAGSLRLPSSRRGTPFLQARLDAQCASVHSHSVLVDSRRRLAASGGNAAGGAVAILTAEFIGSGTSRDEGVGVPASWQARVVRDDFVASGMSRQIEVNAGNTTTPEYECMSMYEDKPERVLRDGRYQGRAVHTASVGFGSVSSAGLDAVLLVDEPALGVMGGLLQSVSSPAEPPVSSLSDPSSGPSMTAPAPFADFPVGDVSPRPDAGGTAMEVDPNRPTSRFVLPSGQGRKSCPPVP
jgi:hypothetical protein